MTKFTLVNPKIDGSVQTSFDISSPLKAADAAYSAIAKYFTNRLERFFFTLQSGGKYYHFVATEKMKGDKVSYSISEFKKKVNTDALEKGQADYDKQHGGSHGGQHGGSHYKKYDLDDDSSDSSPAFRRYNYPIYNWWYDPFIYVVADKDASEKLRTIWYPSILVPGNFVTPFPNYLIHPYAFTFTN